MAKSNSRMKAELVSRFSMDIIKQAKIYHNLNRSISVSEFYHCLEDSLIGAIDRYDPRKGNFVNYYRSLKKFGEYQAFENARVRKEKEEKLFGRRKYLQNVEESLYLSDSVKADSNIFSIAAKIDWMNFIKTKKPVYREVMLLYIDGFSKREISETLDIPYTTVVTIIANMIKRFIQEGEYEKNNNHNEV